MSMKSVVLALITLVCLSSSAMGQNHVLPDVALQGEGAYLKGELIFSLDQKPTPACHASTLAETSSGMIAAWFGGTSEKDPDVGIWLSRLDNGQWSDPKEVVNGIQKNGLRYPCWNPVLFNTTDGSLLLFYKVGPSPREWWGEMMKSGDGGLTWSDPWKLGEDRLGPLLGPVKNKPIELADGSLLSPSSTEVVENGEAFWRVHFELTKDLGRSWEVIGPINDGIAFDAIQPSILTYPNGSMQVLCRSMQKVLVESWSKDGGKTWSEMAVTELPNPSAGTDAVTLTDKRQLIVYNHTSKGRNILNVATSEDGKAWNVVLTLEKQKGEYSYPAVIQSSDGLVHITYTYKRESIKYVVLDPSELK